MSYERILRFCLHQTVSMGAYMFSWKNCFGLSLYMNKWCSNWLQFSKNYFWCIFLVHCSIMSSYLPKTFFFLNFRFSVTTLPHYLLCLSLVLPHLCLLFTDSYPMLSLQSYVWRSSKLHPPQNIFLWSWIR